MSDLYREMQEQAECVPSFRGVLLFLSNMHPSEVYGYPTVEHAYMAAKTLDPLQRIKIKRAPTPVEAKRLGKEVPLRKDWENIKLGVMYKLVREKFGHPDLSEKLCLTQGIELVERNFWHDYFWGVCNGQGENHLGKILMRVREELLPTTRILL